MLLPEYFNVTVIFRRWQYLLTLVSDRIKFSFLLMGIWHLVPELYNILPENPVYSLSKSITGGIRG
jgi:hypothetical protein